MLIWLGIYNLEKCKRCGILGFDKSFLYVACVFVCDFCILIFSFYLLGEINLEGNECTW